MRLRVILIFLIAIGLPVLSAAAGMGPRVFVMSPSHLSAVEDTEILVALSGDEGDGVQLVATLASMDGAVRTEVSRTPAVTGTELALAKVTVPAGALTPFRLGEELALTIQLVSRGKTTAESTVHLTLLAEPAPVEFASWSMVLADKPAQLYTTRPSVLKYIFFNPKNNPKSANVALKFKGDEGKVKAKWKFEVSLPVGLSEQLVYVPSSVTSEARLRNSTLLESKLKRQDNVIAKDQALLDFDLSATAGADPASGSAPLRVSFTANASGGKLPYVYNWTFGDGSAASDQNPFHSFSQPGLYTTTLTVTDALGAKVTDDLTVTVSP